MKQDGNGINAKATVPTIVLVGMMGTGKTSIGKRLAQRLGLPFVDADAEIEAAAGCAIADIFALYGEAEFRSGEKRVMARLLDGPAIVLAAGGGAYIDPDTRRHVQRSAVAVWLRAALPVLLRRVARRNTRPLLQQGDPKAILQRLIGERYPIYAEADVTVDSLDIPQEETVDRVLNALSAKIPAFSQWAAPLK